MNNAFKVHDKSGSGGGGGYIGPGYNRNQGGSVGSYRRDNGKPSDAADMAVSISSNVAAANVATVATNILSDKEARDRGIKRPGGTIPL